MTVKVALNGVVVLCLTVLGACGGGSPSTPPSNACALPKDGTRLKAIRLQAEDGSWEDRSRYLNWYDSSLGTPCTFTTAADGVPRCLPSVAAHWSSMFADAGCSQRVTWGRRCAAPPQYGVAALPATCAAGESVSAYATHMLGPGTVPDLLYLEQADASGNSSCVEVANSDRREVFPLLAEVPPTEFVAAAVERTTGSRIQTSQLAAADGARGNTATLPFDSTFGATCWISFAADGEWRCVPFEAEQVRPVAYADMACTQPVAYQSRRTCAPSFRTTFAGIEEAHVCATVQGAPIYLWPPKLHVHWLDAPSTPAQIFNKTSPAGTATCEASPNVDASELSRYGAELAPSEFVRVSDKEVSCGSFGASGSRLKAHHPVSDDGVALHNGGFSNWVDADTGQDCYFRVAADDVLRCLPSLYPLAGGVARFFADPTCTQALHGVERCVTRPRGAPKFAVWDEPATACLAGFGYVDFHTRVRALGAVVTPSALYGYTLEQPTRCLSVEEAGLGRLEDLVQYYEFHELGAEVPPATFVAGSIATP